MSNTEKTYRSPAQFKRFCDAHDCSVCPLSIGTRCAITYDLDVIEKNIMTWVARNPEPKPVTWTEWWRGLFPEAKFTPCPAGFGIDAPCRGEACLNCKRTTIVPDDMIKAFESVPRPARAEVEV